MAQCVGFDAGGSLVQLPEPCTSFVLVTPAEYSAIAASPFYLTAEDGFLLGSAVVGVWAAAFAIRAAIRALDVAEGPSEAD